MRYNIFIITCLLLAFGNKTVLSQNAFKDVQVECTKELAAEYNYKTFEVTVADSGEYSLSFWLMPTKYANGKFSVYNVYVNGILVDFITPCKSNWQTAVLDNKKSVELRKGTNSIHVSALAPEVPEVEAINVVPQGEDATIDDSAYADYLAVAEQGDSLMEEEEIESSQPTYAAQSTLVTGIIKNVPLYYSFYKIMSFNKGDDLDIHTSGAISHGVDILYIGSRDPSIIGPIAPGLQQQAMETNDEFDYPPITHKSTFVYNHASSTEMQGLNWRGPSEKIRQPHSLKLTNM